MYSTSSLKLTLEQKQAYFTNPYHHCHHDIVHHVTKMCPRVRKTMPHHMFTITSSSPWPSSTSPPFIFQPIENNGFIQKPSHNSFATSPIKHSVQHVEEVIEQAIFNCRFLTLMAVVGSLTGSLLCFLKGCTFVVQSFVEYFQASWDGMGTGNVILMLVEAVDVYLMGTVMLIFGMGLYDLFVNSLDVPGRKRSPNSSRTTVFGSNLFGLFRLRERPKWLEIHSLDELKTKIGHVIVMILLVGMFEKSKKVPVHSGVDLLCFSASILLSSGCLFLLSKLHSTK